MERKDAIDKLVKEFREKNYGDVLNFDEIGDIINEKYGSSKYGDILQAARKRLELAGHMIENVRGIGYKVSIPDNYTGEGVRRIRMASRQIDRSEKILSHAPVNDMSPEAREAHNRVSDNMVTLKAFMAGKCVEMHMLGHARQHPLLAAK